MAENRVGETGSEEHALLCCTYGVFYVYILGKLRVPVAFVEEHVECSLNAKDVWMGEYIKSHCRVEWIRQV